MNPYVCPVVCPVCGGNGLVTQGFYNQTSGQWSTSTTAPETCRTCGGTGIVGATPTHLQPFKSKEVETGYNIEFEVLTIEAIERAIKAEAEVERLRNLHDKSLVRMSIAETQNINLLAELAKYKRAFDLACSNLSAQIDGLYCPADAIDFDLDINYCDNCYTNDCSVCWADFYLQQAEREAVKNEKSKP